MTLAPFSVKTSTRCEAQIDVNYFREDVEMNVGVMHTRGAVPAIVSLRINGKADASTWRRATWKRSSGSGISPH